MGGRPLGFCFAEDFEKVSVFLLWDMHRLVIIRALNGSDVQKQLECSKKIFVAEFRLFSNLLLGPGNIGFIKVKPGDAENQTVFTDV